MPKSQLRQKYACLIGLFTEMCLVDWFVHRNVDHLDSVGSVEALTARRQQLSTVNVLDDFWLLS